MDKATYEIKSQIIDLRVQIGNPMQEVQKLKVEHTEDRVFNKALNGTVHNLSAQVQNLDQRFETATQKTETRAKEQMTTEAAKKMNITEIGELYRRDPVAGRKAMEAQGMKIGTELDGNPWIFVNPTEQKRIRSLDPELADRLQAQAAARVAAMNR